MMKKVKETKDDEKVKEETKDVMNEVNEVKWKASLRASPMKHFYFQIRLSRVP